MYKLFLSQINISNYVLKDAEPLALMGGTSNMGYDYGIQQQERQGRTLINQFPFNQGSLTRAPILFQTRSMVVHEENIVL